MFLKARVEKVPIFLCRFLEVIEHYLFDTVGVYNEFYVIE